MIKIMLVEDDKSLREIYGVRLLAEGYEIKSAGDGEEALAMAIKERPDLIISDVMMPKISGFDMLDILRSTPETKDIKVIMMTALSSEDQRSRGESLGADRYLVKSQVGIEDVVRTVHEVLADTPITAVPASKLFGTLAPSETTTSQPIAQPTQSQPTPTLAQTSVAPQMPITAPVTITIPSPTSVLVAPTQLPQPTAPFSSSAPSSLGENIVNPAPVTNTPQPVTAPTQPQIVPEPTFAPATPIQVPTTYTTTTTPWQPILTPQQPTQPRPNAVVPDFTALINKELDDDAPAPATPVQPPQA